ncbi:MAG: vanadium-dependent haloperoxidase [Acidimicrobiales bacterium]
MAAIFTASPTAGAQDTATEPAPSPDAAVEAAGWGALASRHGDGSQSGQPVPVPAPGSGVWAPTPPATAGLTSWLGSARPFALRSPDQYRPPASRLESSRYRRDLDELRRLGGASSTERTEEQTLVARFWGDQPIDQNQRALRAQAAKLGWGVSPTARLFAAVLTSEVDAIIACWDAKYTYHFWRPWQSAPTVEPGWTPLLATPNHPEYPSAHGCLTGALAYSLAGIMGTDAIDVEIDAANIGVTRSYPTRDALLEEVGDARVWAGIHYRHSVDTGKQLAKRVVRYNLSRNFQINE